MSFISDFFKDISGRTARDASNQAGQIQSQAGKDAAAEVGVAGEQALGLFDPFKDVGQHGADLSTSFGNPSADMAFLQNNPLFQMSIDNANRNTNARAASSGRLSAGDTLQQLSNNVLLSASPLLQRRDNQALQLLNFGGNMAGQQAGILQNTAANRGNLLTGAAASQAAGLVGAANAMGAGANNLFGLGGNIIGSGALDGIFSSTPSLPAAGSAPSAISNTDFGNTFSSTNLLGSP